MSNASNTRYPAIDLIRGMTVCFMIIVNTGGSGAEPYPLLQHAEWHGFTPTDLVFPTFLFVVGNALAFTLPKLKDIGNGEATLKILKRTALIFLLGYLMYWFPFVRMDETGGWSLKPIAETRILGVLQRIALCYGISAILLRVWSARTIWITGILILAGYWAMLAWGGDDTIEGNLVRQIDRLLLGDAWRQYRLRSRRPAEYTSRTDQCVDRIPCSHAYQKTWQYLQNGVRSARGSHFFTGSLLLMGQTLPDKQETMDKFFQRTHQRPVDGHPWITYPSHGDK
jgi:hypothetical protein